MLRAFPPICGLVREVFANPSQPQTIDTAWLRWNGGVIRRLALEIYNERRFTDLSVLGDALEDASCRDDAILRHCWERHGHVRGCWVVDLLLARE